MLDNLRNLFGDLKYGGSRRHRNLRVVPLFGPQSGPETHTLLEAMDSGSAEVTEVSDSGRVPELMVRNSSYNHLLILDGEELVGAKQNRILNASILVAPGTNVTVPVSCIEAGRWARRSRRFVSRERVMPSTLRRAKQMRVSTNLKSRGTFDANQGAVWDEVDAYSRQRGVQSATGALSDVLEVEQEGVDQYVDFLPALEGQIGLVAYVGNRFVGLDLMGQTNAYEATHRRLMRSYAAEALACRSYRGEETHGNGELPSIPELLKTVFTGDISVHPSPGVGNDVRIESRDGQLSALWAEEGLAHLSLFPAN